jgi:hypothetical protein
MYLISATGNVLRRIAGILLSLLLLACLFAGKPCYAQVVVKPSDRFYVRMAGHILNSQKKPISYATVRNLTNRKAVVADSLGFFSIVLSQYDTLEFRRVGYKTAYYRKDQGKNGNYYQDIFLQEEAYALDEVTIYRKPDRTVRSIAVNPDYNRVDRFQLHMFARPEDRHELKPDISSPFSYIYDQFSKRGIATRKVYELRAQQRLATLVSIRYNDDYVSSLTGLQGRDLAEFMVYCHLSQDFILSASDYELAAATLNCYRRFIDE